MPNSTIDDVLRNEMLLDARLKLEEASHYGYSPTRYPYAREGNIVPIRATRAIISEFLNKHYSNKISRKGSVIRRGSKRKIFWEVVEDAARQLGYERRHVVGKYSPEERTTTVHVLPADASNSQRGQIYWVKTNNESAQMQAEPLK